MTPAQQKWLAENPGYGVVSAEQHHDDYARACNGRRPWPHDKVLCGDSSTLPGDSFCVGSRLYVRPTHYIGNVVWGMREKLRRFHVPVRRGPGMLPRPRSVAAG